MKGRPFGNKNHFIHGKTLSAAEWARLLGAGKNTITTRYHRGWSTEECLFGRKKVIR